MQLELKTSKYVVSADGEVETRLFSTKRGHILTVRNAVWDHIRSGDFAALNSEDLAILVDSGILVPSHEDELAELLAENRSVTASSSVIGLILIPSAFCPLACNKAEYGGYCGQEHTAAKMAQEKQDALIASLNDAICQHHDSVSVSWFGGEPLAAFDVLGQLSIRIQDCARQHGLSYHSDLTTGGTLLTPEVSRKCYLEFGVEAVNVTLDGPREVHDLRRCTKGGSPTFDRIISHLDAIIADSELSGMKISIRVNVDRRNLLSVPELIEFFYSKGWQQRIELYFASVHSWGLLSNSDKRLETPEFAVHEAEWFELMIQRGFTPSLLPGKKNTVCRAASTNRVVIGHDGEVHKCTETPLTRFSASYDLEQMKRGAPSKVSGNGHDRLGNVGDVKLLPEGTEWKWLDAIERGAYPCTGCVFLPCCGGACPLSWMNGGSPCPSYKFNMPERLRLFPALSKIDGRSSSNCKTRKLRQEYSPIWLLSRASDVDTESLERFENFLTSSRRQASLGYMATAKRQHANAVSTMPSLGLRPEIVHLGNAAELASKAYLAFKGVYEESAESLLSRAIKELREAQRCAAALDTAPSEIQLLINILRVTGETSDDLAMKVSTFLTDFSPMSYNGMTFDPRAGGLNETRGALLGSLPKMIRANKALE